VQPSRGFGAHSHANMEILTYGLEGALEHRDSLGTGSIIRPELRPRAKTDTHFVLFDLA
jgi:redox-sensitive bicupin YhaK (pirin superfamily)